MTRYGMIAAIWIATLSSIGGGGTFLWNYVSTISQELGELRSDVKHYEESLNQLTEKLYKCD